MNNELRDFFIEFFKTLGTRDLKTDKQLVAILNKYTYWNCNEAELEVNDIHVPDEIKDKFKYFLIKAGVLVEEECYTIGYANMYTTNYLLDDTRVYLQEECGVVDFESVMPSYVKEDVLYVVEPRIEPEQGGIYVNIAKFNDPVSFGEIKKIFELSNQDITDIQKELTDIFETA